MAVSRPSSRAFIAGHSSSMQLNHTVSRVVPSSLYIHLRIVPSSTRPSRRMAFCDFRLVELVLYSTRFTRHVSKAWRIIRYLASVLSAVRWNSSPSHVQPISTRLCSRTMLPKRVEPATRPLARWMVTNGSVTPRDCSAMALSK